VVPAGQAILRPMITTLQNFRTKTLNWMVTRLHMGSASKVLGR
jgi:hypothetical protein